MGGKVSVTEAGFGETARPKIKVCGRRVGAFYYLFPASFWLAVTDLLKTSGFVGNPFLLFIFIPVSSIPSLAPETCRCAPARGRVSVTPTWARHLAK